MPTKAQLEKELERLRARNLELEPTAEPLPPDGPTEGPTPSEDLGSDVEMFFREAGSPGQEKYIDAHWYNDEGDGRLKFVERYSLDSFSLPAVKDKHGGGRWVFRLKQADGGKFIASRTEHIDGPRISGSSAKESDDPRTLTEKLMDQQGQITEKLEELRKGPPPQLAGSDPLTMAMTIFSSLEAVLAPQRELIQQIALKSGGDGANFSEMFKVFKMGMDLGKDSAPSGPDPMGAVLEKTLPPLLDVIGKGNTPPTIPTDPAPSPPEETELEVARPTNRPPWDVLLSPQLPMLLKWARADKDPELRAEFVVDELPGEAEAIVLAALQKGPEFFSEFMLLHPEAKPWEEWLRSFWVAVADQYTWGEGELAEFPHPFRPVLEPQQELHETEAVEELEEPAQDPAVSDGVEVGTH